MTAPTRPQGAAQQASSEWADGIAMCREECAEIKRDKSCRALALDCTAAGREVSRAVWEEPPRKRTLVVSWRYVESALALGHATRLPLVDLGG